MTQEMIKDLNFHKRKDLKATITLNLGDFGIQATKKNGMAGAFYFCLKACDFVFFE